MKKNMKKNMLWMLLSLMAAAIMMPLSATAQEAQTETRIAVVSDIHVMAPSLLPEGAKVEGTEWTADYANERKMLEQSAGLFDQFIDAMESEAPDVLLITGDLTKDGEMASHQYVIDKLAELKTALKNKKSKIYVIPGNHDITTGTVYKYDDDGNRSELKNDEKMTTTAAFASFYQGYGYGIEKIDDNNDNNFVQDPNGSLSYVAEIADGLYLLAIDSHNNGIVSQNTLTWICDQAKVIRGAGKRVIAMMHHPLFPHITGADMFIETYTVKYKPTENNENTYEDVRNTLIDAGVNVILTGHFHTSDIAYDWNDNADNGIYDINTGSLISYPCDYRMLTLSADKSTLSVTTNSIIEGNNDFSANAKVFLEARMKTKIENYIIDNKPLLADYASILSPVAAKAFIAHAEGDENTEENTTAQSVLDDYKFIKNVALWAGYDDKVVQLEPILYSMLKDISNYKDGTLSSGHENRTTDRTLSGITLTALESSGTLNLSDDKDIRTAINCYDGKTVNVRINTSGINAARLSNRASSLYKDGAWNTICLPFDLTDGDLTDNVSFSGTPLEGAKVKTLESSSFNSSTGELTLTFSDDLDAIDAGKPYILKWQNYGEQPINSLSFDNVTINKAIKAVPTSANLNDAPASFVGTYNPKSFNDDDDSILLIGSETQGDKVKSTLFYPKAGASVSSFRAYFQLADDYTAGEPDTPEQGTGTIRNFVLNFGDDDSATGIIAIGNSQSSTLNAQRSEWFTLDGRRLAAKPTAKGLYIHAGRKVVIK